MAECDVKAVARLKRTCRTLAAIFITVSLTSYSSPVSGIGQEAARTRDGELAVPSKVRRSTPSAGLLQELSAKYDGFIPRYG